RLTLEDRVELDLAAAGLVVLGDLPAGPDLDQVEAERGGAERLARELPGRVAGALHRLELVAVLDCVSSRQSILSLWFHGPSYAQRTSPSKSIGAGARSA